MTPLRVKALLLSLAGMTPILLCSQADVHGTSDRSFVPYDSVGIRWSKAEWFGKSRINLGSYGTATFKQGISSSSNRVFVNGREELMQKTPFRVELQDSAGAAFTTRGQKFWSSGYWEEDDGGLQIAGELLKLPEVLTESETYVGDPVNLEISEAELRHSLQPDDLWKLHLKRNRSTGEIMEELDAYLSNGTRIISIKGPTGADPSDTPATRPGFSYYEFTEDGIPIARASRQQPVVYFPAETSQFTRSLILTAILAAGL